MPVIRVNAAFKKIHPAALSRQIHVLTGRIETSEVKKTIADVLAYLATVSTVAREIDAAYRAELEKLA